MLVMLFLVVQGMFSNGGLECDSVCTHVKQTDVTMMDVKRPAKIVCE